VCGILQPVVSNGGGREEEEITSNHSAVPRVLVVGFDSATWLVMGPLLEAGRLPTLARLVAEGAHGPLRSSIPYVSAAAWVTFATGSNPGRHGVYDFVRRRADSYDVELVSAGQVRAPTLWQLLSAAGRRVGVLNVPMTYPPCAVNGALVAGMLTPSLQSPFTYPPDLRERLLRAVPGYSLEPTILGAVPRTEMKARLQREVVDGAEQRMAAARFLMDELGTWDMFIVVFTGLDRLQTYLWDDVDPHHPLHDPASAARFGDAIPAHYEQLDRLLGEFLATVDPQTTTVVVMSDHGLGSVHQFFFPNRWLAETGYLLWRRGASAATAWGRQLLKRAGLGGLAKRAVARLFPGWAAPTRLRSATFVRDVDWTRTRVFWAADNGFWLNVKGREPQGIVAPGAEYEVLCQELTSALLALRDPLHGEPVVDEVWRRDELYAGPFVHESPDLRVVWHEVPQERRTHFAASELWGEQPFGTSTLSGDHMRDGILVAWGRGVQPGVAVTGASLLDLAPTILYLLDQPIPLGMDGRVLQAMIDPDLAAARPERRQQVDVRVRSADGFAPGDEETVTRRLRDLGYLS
jgi:predicted AlkP superfamily phosphohydrolase/phosphomutase